MSKDTEDMVEARLRPMADRKVDAVRQRLPGTRSFTVVDGKQSDPTVKEPKRQQLMGLQPEKYVVEAPIRGVDGGWRRVPRKVVDVLREQGQQVETRELTPETGE